MLPPLITQQSPDGQVDLVVGRLAALGFKFNSSNEPDTPSLHGNICLTAMLPTQQTDLRPLTYAISTSSSSHMDAR